MSCPLLTNWQATRNDGLPLSTYIRGTVPFWLRSVVFTCSAPRKIGFVRNSIVVRFAAPYVLRAEAGTPVATPLEWTEVEHGFDPPRSCCDRTSAFYGTRGSY